MGDTEKKVFRTCIKGSIQAVWNELTRTDTTQRAVYNARLHTPGLQPGAPMQMRSANGRNVMVVGEVMAFDPPHRFVHSFRSTMYDDPPCTVSYELRETPEGVEVTLTVDQMPAGTRTARDMAKGGDFILGNLKVIVETGHPPLGARAMYLMFGAMGFMLPARTKAEHWPLGGADDGE